jgi:hypothetical protein
MDSYRLAKAGELIYQLKSLIAGSFSDYRCIFAPRLCNRVAHALARRDVYLIKVMASIGTSHRPV